MSEGAWIAAIGAAVIAATILVSVAIDAFF